MSALKKRKKDTRKYKRASARNLERNEKSETRGKNRQVSDNRIRGTRYPPERKEKEEHVILLTIQKARKVGIPSKEQK